MCVCVYICKSAEKSQVKFKDAPNQLSHFNISHVKLTPIFPKLVFVTILIFSYPCKYYLSKYLSISSITQESGKRKFPVLATGKKLEMN